jgi:hypothetical protein
MIQAHIVLRPAGKFKIRKCIMEKLNVFNRIPVTLPEKEIFSRLKYNIHKTEMDDESRKKILSAINKGFALCEPKGAWTRSDITDRSEESLTFANGIVIKSRSIVKLLSDSVAAVFFSATAGQAIVEISAESFRNGDGASAVIYDAVGSETAEAAVDWINTYISRELNRRGESLTSMRFSPGYGDFLLENQRHFFELLKLADFGIKLTDRYIFIPEKTVTAIAGIEKNRRGE